MRATPDGDRETDLVAHLSPQPSGDLEWVAGHLQQPGDVEERLVDRYALDERRRPLEDREDGLARLDVGIEAGRHDDGVRAQRARLGATHGRPHAVGLRLVARSEHDPAADEHRASAQRGVVALLDRGVEAVEVGVQDLPHQAHDSYVRTYFRITERASPSPAQRSSVRSRTWTSPLRSSRSPTATTADTPAARAAAMPAAASSSTTVSAAATPSRWAAPEIALGMGFALRDVVGGHEHLGHGDPRGAQPAPRRVRGART